MPEDRPENKAELLEHIRSGWEELQRLLGVLAPDQWEQRLGDGWRVRDHVAHLTAWERSLLALIRGESRPAVFGLTQAEEDALGIDSINARIVANASGLATAAIREQSGLTHEEVVSLVETMSDEDLAKPYSHYQSDPALRYKAAPVMGWVSGNTWEHYDEHMSWLRDAGVGR